MAESFLQKVTFERPTRPARYSMGHFDPVNVRRGRLGFIVSHRQHERRLSGMWYGGGGEGGDMKHKVLNFAAMLSLLIRKAPAGLVR